MSWRERLYRRLSPPAAAELRALAGDDASMLEEMRLRIYRPMEFVFAGGRRQTGFCPDRKQMDELVAALSGYALYACEKQMAQGYIPLPGGHRVGVCGRVVCEAGTAVRLAEVTSVCIRIARHIDGASHPVRRYLINEQGTPARVLLLGPPGCGKTTVLRDAAIYLSDHCGLHVCAADEREELFPGGENHTTQRLDVMRSGAKAETMRMLIRTMAPQVLVTDEIGSWEDVGALADAARCGVGLLASAHASSLRDIQERPALRRLLRDRVFDRYLLLGRHGVCLAVCGGEGELLHERGDAGEQMGDCCDGADWRKCDGLCGSGRGADAGMLSAGNEKVPDAHERCGTV